MKTKLILLAATLAFASSALADTLLGQGYIVNGKLYSIVMHITNDGGVEPTPSDKVIKLSNGQRSYWVSSKDLWNAKTYAKMDVALPSQDFVLIKVKGGRGQGDRWVVTKIRDEYKLGSKTAGVELINEDGQNTFSMDELKAIKGEQMTPAQLMSEIARAPRGTTVSIDSATESFLKAESVRRSDTAKVWTDLEDAIDAHNLGPSQKSSVIADGVTLNAEEAARIGRSAAER